MDAVTPGKDFVRPRREVRFLAISVFFIFCFISLLGHHPSNEDFYWHLATGKYIVENQSLPKDDPFSYTSGNAPSERKSYILKGYWLSQVIFYEVYRLWDLKGIIVLRAVFLLAFLFFVFLTVKKQGVHDIFSLLVVSVVFWYALIAEGERPQLFTFFMFSVIYYLLEDYRKHRSKKVYLVPVLILVLSNMHPGYIICFVPLSVYLAGESIRYISRQGRRDNRVKGFLLITTLSFLFSYLNPSRWDIFTGLVSSRFLTQNTMNVVEMMPPFRLYSLRMIPIDYPYIIFLSLSLLSILFIRKTGLVQVLLLIAFTLISISAYRFLMFYLCIAAPIVARITVFVKDKTSGARLSGILRPKESSIYLIVSIIGILLMINASVSLAGFSFKGNELLFIPRKAADFLSDVDIKGNMYNEYGLGGYLAWRLSPEKKVFIDSRSLDPSVTEEYRVVAFTYKDPSVSWESIMRKYDVSYVIMKPLWPTGKIIPLVEKLLDSKDWALIYADHLALILIRRDSGNSSLIKSYEMEKDKGINTIIVQASAWAMSPNQANPNYFITLGKMFFRLGRFVDSEKAFLMARERDPEGRETRDWLGRLQEKRKPES